MQKQGVENRKTSAFALPTVLIASIVLLTILSVSVTATAAVRTALKNQYYVQLAQVAGEAGVAMAKACLAQTNNVPTWTDAKPLTPATDCSGNVVLGPTVKALVVAGGGSGGGSTGGGGGAGGVLYSDAVGIGQGSYSVTVGGGGAIPGNQSHGNNGANSSFNGMTAIGGGGGGNTSSDKSADSGGSNGGSGGGGQAYHTTVYASGTGTAGQGYAGGTVTSSTTNAAGGGGAGGAGTSGSTTTSTGGNGGPGVAYSISGAMVYYGAGGGGAQSGSAGTGGNGDASPGSSNTVGSNGRPNSGDGGGGGWNYTGGNGGAGGSGVVIIAFPTSAGIDADGGTTTISGPNEIHKFTSNGTFTVNDPGSASCPTDPRCSVTVNGNVRSSFSIPKPTVDASGRALTILNNGYTEITRTSNGAVWRTYRQPSVQNAVVPDLCSGNATSARGWSNAAKATQQGVLSNAPSAQSIGLSASATSPGKVYFRKDFSVAKAGMYDVNIGTISVQDAAITYIDGVQSAYTNGGSQGTASLYLTPGCHSIYVRLYNQAYLPRQSSFQFAISSANAATPLVVSDTSWRVTASDLVHFSTNNFDEANYWEPVLVAGSFGDSSLPWGSGPSDWPSGSGDSNTLWITTQYGGGSPFTRPSSSTAWFRSSQFTMSSNTDVDVSTVCDDACSVYLDGVQLYSATYAQKVVNTTINIGAGTHTFGVMLTNNSGASGFLFAATKTSNNALVLRSDASWHATVGWSPSANDIYSYDTTFNPTPPIQ